jgi:hypothetical protein
MQYQVFATIGKKKKENDEAKKDKIIPCATKTPRSMTLKCYRARANGQDQNINRQGGKKKKPFKYVSRKRREARVTGT